MSEYGSVRQYQERATGQGVTAAVVCLVCVGSEKECPDCFKLGFEWFAVAHPDRTAIYEPDKERIVMREVYR